MAIAETQTQSLEKSKHFYFYTTRKGLCLPPFTFPVTQTTLTSEGRRRGGRTAIFRRSMAPTPRVCPQASQGKPRYPELPRLDALPKRPAAAPELRGRRWLAEAEAGRRGGQRRLSHLPSGSWRLWVTRTATILKKITSGRQARAPSISSGCLSKPTQRGHGTLQ